MFKRTRKYKLDRDFRVMEKSRSGWEIALGVLRFLVVTISLSLLYYLVFALFFDTDVEKNLEKENRAYKKIYSDAVNRIDLLEDVLSGLEARDDGLYEELFHTPAPSDTRIAGIDLLALSDTLTEATLEAQTAGRIAKNESRARTVEAEFRRIYELAGEKGFSAPPLRLPLIDFKTARTGAGVGMKVSPFTNVPTTHYGIDLMASSGDPVIAPADGTVLRVVHSRKTQGNVIVLEHAGGYRTQYAHLSEIKVQSGQRVKKGQIIASVGMSGSSYAPHLHYEVARDSVALDPTAFFFLDLTPRAYADMIIISTSTGRSMD